MTNFLQVGDRFINLAAIAMVEHHREHNALKVLFLNQSSQVLTGDEAQILLTHLERRSHHNAETMSILWPESAGTPIGDSA